MNNQCFLSGGDYENKNEVGLWSIDNDAMALALFAGKNVRHHRTGPPNEDSAGAVFNRENSLPGSIMISEQESSASLVHPDNIADMELSHKIPQLHINKSMTSSIPYEKDNQRGEWVSQHYSSKSTHISELKVVTYNIYFNTYCQGERLKSLLDILKKCDADIIALQEVNKFSFTAILKEKWIGDSYYVNTVKVESVYPYGVLLLSRIPFRKVNYLTLPGTMGRKLLTSVLHINDKEIHLATVHLESLRSSMQIRRYQMQLIFGSLNKCPDVLLLGDFNFCATWAEENQHIPPHYKDAWLYLRPDDPGYTEDTAINLMRRKLKGKAKQVRFDRVLYKFNSPMWKPVSIELLGKEPVSEDSPEVFPSDHFGLKATFNISEKTTLPDKQ